MRVERVCMYFVAAFRSHFKPTRRSRLGDHEGVRLHFVDILRQTDHRSELRFLR